MPGTIAAQLGFRSFEALVESPSEQPVLLLVDNCEHVLAAAADAIATLLDACRAPTVLATSRSPLGVPGESLVVLGPLPVPPTDDADSPALRLFRERAADAGVTVSDEEGPSLVRLCRELDGVPLALEIAAARLRTMSAAEILERLHSGVDVLARTAYRGVRRHRSVTETVQWSYDLLPPDIADGFERLGVFAGPFSAAMADAVAGTADAAATDALLQAMVEASLLAVEHRGAATWYRMLVTVRAFARRRLHEHGGADATMDALADHVVATVRALTEASHAGWSGLQLQDLMVLYENVATALRWCLDHDERPTRAVWLCGVLWGVVHQAHADDIAALAEASLSRWPDTTAPGVADIAAVLATARQLLGDATGSRSLAEATLPDADHAPYAPVTLPRLLAHAAHARGDAVQAIELFDEASAAARSREMTGMAMECEAFRASLLADVGRGDEALSELARILEEARTTGADLNGIWALTTEGYVRLRLDPGSASPVITEALSLSRRAGYPAGVVAGLRSMAMSQLTTGSTVDAANTLLTLVEEPLALAAVGSDLRMLLDITAVVLHRLGRPGSADLAATAQASAGVSVLLSIGHELFPLPPRTGGRVLARRDAIALARRELAKLVETGPDAAQAASSIPRAPTAVRPEAPSAGGADLTDGGSGDSLFADAVFADRGELWEVGYAGRTVHVRAAKGVSDLARLLRQPHHEVHCLELMGVAVDQDSTGEVLDPESRRSLEQRLRDLQAEIDEAEADHDLGRADRAQQEFDVLVDHLTTALGLGGRSRRAAGTANGRAPRSPSGSGRRCADWLRCTPTWAAASRHRSRPAHSAPTVPSNPSTGGREGLVSRGRD